MVIIVIIVIIIIIIIIIINIIVAVVVIVVVQNDIDIQVFFSGCIPPNQQVSSVLQLRVIFL